MNIKKQLRAHALEESENIKDDVFSFLYRGTVVAQVRFPPASIVIDTDKVASLKAILGDSFNDCFTVTTQVKPTSKFSSIVDDLGIETKIASHLRMRSNTPRVSFF